MPSAVLKGLRQQTADVLSRQESWPAVATPRPPCVGDVLMMTTSDKRPDFWLVADRRPEPVESLRLVPADINPMCGTNDVTVPEDGATGALTARCAFAVWLEITTVRPLARAGLVGGDAIAPVRQRLAALDVGEEIGTELDRDTEAELEYRDLVAELTEARHQLLADAGDGNPAANDPRLGLQQPSSEGRFIPLLALAASLVLALGVAAGWAWRGSRTGPSVQAVISSEPMADLPFEWLAPFGQIRNQVAGESIQVFPLKPDVPYFGLFLDVGVGGDDNEYRLVIRREGAEEDWWSGSARRTGTAEVFVLLPTTGLETGNYSFELYATIDSANPSFVYELALDRGIVVP